MSTPTPGAAPAPTTPTTPPASAPPPTNSTASPPPAVVVPPVSSSPPPPVTPVDPPASSPPPPTTVPPPVTSPTPPSTTPVSPGASPAPPVTPVVSPPAPVTPGVSSPPPPPASSRSPPGGSRGSPPPPPATRSPTRPSSSTPPPPSDSSPGISTGLVVGVAIGGVIVLVILSLLFICCKKKKRRNQGPIDYYGGPPPPKDAPYGVPPRQWQYNAPPPPADHVVSIPPKLTPPPGLAPWPPQSTSSSIAMTPQPPPPPPFLNSGGSGSNYSDYDSPLPPPSPGVSLGFSKSSFTYEELVRATDGFSEANLLGSGGFGYVHKGILPNGKEVAVKHLKVGSGQGEREFQAEVEIISRVHHKHLVSLVGYCSTGSQRMLVYEFVPNNTMEFHLHGKGRPTMDWPTRLKIALGSAKGLAYLHEDCHPKIIHRDIKAANILIDMRFEAKVADFGLAKFSSDTNTHVSTRVMGTFGYLAPEYAASGKLTEKSDVFSYGVMLLELITGRRPVDSTNTYMDDSLVDWARPMLLRAQEDGNYDALVDPRLQSYNPNEMARMVDCAAAAVRHSARRRPQMSQIVRALEGDASLSDLNEGVRPGHSTMYSSHESSDYDTFQYNEDMKKFRKMALNSQEYPSSEFSGVPTSEYGLNPSASSNESGGQTTREVKKMKKNIQNFIGHSS